MSSLLTAAAGITARIRNLAERPQSLTVRDLIDRYMAVYAGRDGSIGQRLDTWKILIGDFTLEKLDSDLIYAGRSELATLPALAYKGLDHEGKPIFKSKSRHRNKSPATLNKYISALGSLFSWAITQRLAPRGWVHPCRGVKLLREADGRVRFLDDGERAQLLDACKSSQYPRLYALVLMGMLTGARRGELLALTWADIDLAHAVARLGRTKNGDRRTLVLLPQVVEALRPFLSSDVSRYVFGSTRTRHQTPASIDTAWKHAIARADVKDFKFHDLRHCCASYLAQAGVPLNVIADVLGHRRMDMTRRYAHLTTQTKATAMASALGKIGL
jgi:integrase